MTANQVCRLNHLCQVTARCFAEGTGCREPVPALAMLCLPTTSLEYSGASASASWRRCSQTMCFPGVVCPGRLKVILLYGGGKDPAPT